MVRVKEEEVWATLLKYAWKGKPFEAGKTEIQVSLQPQDTHIGDSPDFILWLKVSLRLFAQNLRVEIPIPVEAETKGIDEALKDLKKFIERGNYPLRLPMLVIAAKGYSTMVQSANLPVRFMIKQIPVRLLEY